MSIIKMVSSAEFALVARVCAVAAVPIGVLGAGIITLSGIIFSDIRVDVRATKTAVDTMVTTVSNQGVLLGEHTRRLDKIEAMAMPWNSAPPLSREPAKYPR